VVRTDAGFAFAGYLVGHMVGQVFRPISSPLVRVSTQNGG